MTKVDGKVAELLAKHPSMTKEQALEIITAKNERKNKKRAERAERESAKIARNEANRPEES